MKTFCIASKTANEYGFRPVVTNTWWKENPDPENYAVVPEEMIEDIVATQGYCDIKLSKDKTTVIAFTAREIPVFEEPEEPVTVAEQLRADIDYLAIMTGVTL